MHAVLQGMARYAGLARRLGPNLEVFNSLRWTDHRAQRIKMESDGPDDSSRITSVGDAE